MIKSLDAYERKFCPIERRSNRWSRRSSQWVILTSCLIILSISVIRVRTLEIERSCEISQRIAKSSRVCKMLKSIYEWRVHLFALHAPAFRLQRAAFSVEIIPIATKSNYEMKWFIEQWICRNRR
jgi:hypothetical protein